MENLNTSSRRESVDESGRIWEGWLNKDGVIGKEVPQFKVGEALWYITRAYSPLLVRVFVEEIEDHFRKNHDDAYLFYDIDEPVGHSLLADELYLPEEFEMAVEVFAEEYQRRIKFFENLGKLDKVDRFATLAQYRKKVQDFIAHTWQDGHPGFAPLPDKQLGVDWFNADALLDENFKLKRS